MRRDLQDGLSPRAVGMCSGLAGRTAAGWAGACSGQSGRAHAEQKGQLEAEAGSLYASTAAWC